MNGEEPNNRSEGAPSGGRPTPPTKTADQRTYAQRCLAQVGTEPPRYDRHCSVRGCPCGHTVCNRGWIDTQHYARTEPCETCKPDTAGRLNTRETYRRMGYPAAALANAMTPPPPLGGTRAR